MTIWVVEESRDGGQTWKPRQAGFLMKRDTADKLTEKWNQWCDGRKIFRTAAYIPAEDARG
jgi:hypothetical protein